MAGCTKFDEIAEAWPGALLGGGAAAGDADAAGEPEDGSGSAGARPSTAEREDATVREALEAHAEACLACRERLDERVYMDRLLTGTFRWLDTDLRPQRQAVLARIGGRPAAAVSAEHDPQRPEPRSARLPAAPPERGRIPFLGKKRFLFLAINALAAALLLTAYAGYLSLMRAQREVLARGTLIEVKNLAIALRAGAERDGEALPAAGERAIVLALLDDPPPSRAGGPADGEPVGAAERASRAGLPTGRLDNGRLLDGYGFPFVYVRADDHSALVYSRGANGRDEGGGGDDVACSIVLH